MIRSLRRKHIIIWAILAVLLPIGMVAAWMVVPKPVYVSLRNPPLFRELPIVRARTTKAGYTACLRSDAGTTRLQLEWINILPLTIPSAVIYETTDTVSRAFPGEAALIGRIDGRGTFQFPLKPRADSGERHFVLYDFIHRRVIDRLNL